MRRSVALLALLSVVVAGCSTVSFTVNIDVDPRGPVPASTMFAGAASSTLTVPPGYPMMGYSIAGQFSRGTWVPITCNVVYVRDTMGTQYFIVSTDLWAMPGGLASRAVEIMHMEDASSRSIGLENVMCTALHIHHCAGNFATCPSYNTAASFGIGFDEALFNYLAQKIAHTMLRARATAEAATLSYSESVVAGLSRNRSYPAFLQNDSADRAALFAENSNVDTASISAWPAELSTRITAMAVDPVLRLLQVRSKAKGRNIALVPLYALHATATGEATEVYSSDIYGVARELLRSELLRDSALVVAFLNGSEGDVAPNYLRHDRSDAMRIGRQLAQSIQTLVQRPAAEELHGKIEAYYLDQKLAGQTFPFDNRQGDCYCTYPSALQTSEESVIGTAMFGGASDGRTILYSLGCRDGMISDGCDPVQGQKLPALTTVVDLMTSKGIARNIASTVIGGISSKAPDHAPVSMLSLGDLLLVGLPGEFTTMMGKFIRDTIQSVSKKKHVVLVGFANEYASYITTPCEYRAQYYEGASTLFGAASGPWFKYLALQAYANGPVGPTDRTLQYDAGSAASFGVRSDHTDAWWNAAYDLSNLLVDENGTPMPLATFALPEIDGAADTVASSLAVRYTFRDITVPLQAGLDHASVAADTVRYLPTARVETTDAAHMVSNATEIIVAMDSKTVNAAQWSVYFLGCKRMRGRTARMTITAPSGRVLSSTFVIP